MGKRNLLIAVIALFVCVPNLVLANDNPFDKKKGIHIQADNAWLIKDKTATRSGSDSGDFYHLFYDRKQLRLRITDGAEDSEVSARKYQHLAVEDMMVDGKRLPLFQWCLGNQQKHSRFLQQGLKVKQGVCNNQGSSGAFILRLNAATLDTLKKGKTLTYKIKPFRSSMDVNFDISDFLDVVAKLSTTVRLVQKKQPADPVIALDKAVAEMCKVSPPKKFSKIAPVKYACDDIAKKTEAEASVEALVVKERDRQAKLAAERERKKKAAAEAKKEAEAKKLAKQKAEQERLAAEQAALAETEASKREMNAAISNKMIAVCMKKWAVGEHRCYCEKFIEQAPAGIESDPSCSAE